MPCGVAVPPAAHRSGRRRKRSCAPDRSLTTNDHDVQKSALQAARGATAATAALGPVCGVTQGYNVDDGVVVTSERRAAGADDWVMVMAAADLRCELPSWEFLEVDDLLPFEVLVIDVAAK